MKSDSFVSVVLVVDQYTTTLHEAVTQIQSDLDRRYSDYEVVLIAQGPMLDSVVAGQVELMLKQLPSVRYIQLAAHVHTDVAWAAGLENAIGDFVLLLDYSVDPLSVIPDVVKICKSGFDVVVGVAKQPQTFVYRFFRACSDRILQAVDYHLPRNATGLRCLSRRAVNSVTSTGRFHHQFYLRIQKTGYPSCSFVYELCPGAVLEKSLIRGFRHLVRLLVFNSSRPLRWMSGMGLMGSCAAFLFAAYSVLIHLISGNVVQGWTTTILFMSMLFMLQFIMMAFFGEYLGRLLDDRSEQADYSVVFEQNSTVMVNQDRVNVLDESTSHDQNLVQTGRNQ
ncbi:glycosyl transferase family 2 [Uliginosibacterium gangwonense]|uniref:glycosyl transferase family 2 n=1 Tax=Uliginosibacterium gangwonense TaxID=392736 RepID=UPI00039CAF4C|nr:glycosyl transferase family 2 [Uliginosibacterium gangwonense]